MQSNDFSMLYVYKEDLVQNDVTTLDVCFIYHKGFHQHLFFFYCIKHLKELILQPHKSCLVEQVNVQKNKK